MKQLPGKRSAAFTLMEMLAVIAIVSILAALLLPAIGNTQAKVRRVQCVSNLRQTGLAFDIFLHDHNDLFPMEVSTNQGGTLEFAAASFQSSGGFDAGYRHFQVLSNELVTPRLLVCPSDPARLPASDFANLQNRNISYFVGMNADFYKPNSIVAGDRNITSAFSARGAFIRLDDNSRVNWTRELHVLKGDVLYADGHVERINASVLKLHKQDAPATMDLLLPAVKHPSSRSAAYALWDAPERLSFPPSSPPPSSKSEPAGQKKPAPAQTVANALL